MPSIETIYQESVKPLPLNDQLRLAEMIVKRAGTGRAGQPARKQSAHEILENLKSPKHPRSAAEIDEYLRTERDAWDN